MISDFNNPARDVDILVTSMELSAFGLNLQDASPCPYEWAESESRFRTLLRTWSHLTSRLSATRPLATATSLNTWRRASENMYQSRSIVSS